MLAEAGLVARRKEGLQVFYRLDDPLVERLCKLVCETIVEEAREEVDRQKKLLDGWGGRKRQSMKVMQLVLLGWATTRTRAPEAAWLMARPCSTMAGALSRSKSRRFG